MGRISTLDPSGYRTQPSGSEEMWIPRVMYSEASAFWCSFSGPLGTKQEHTVRQFLVLYSVTFFFAESGALVDSPTM